MLKKAFTLAETLIVIGIIGVVAALTIPNLTQSTNDKEKVAKVKKIYSNLEDAIGRATAVYGPVETWSVGITDYKQQSQRVGDRITEFMKVSKNCGLNGDGCFSTGPFFYEDGTQWDNNREADMKGNFYRIITADGTSIAFGLSGKNAFFINIDIDGPNKGKNKYGSDSFTFHYGFQDDGQLDYYSRDNTNLTGNFQSYYDIDAWVMLNDNMDYLKLDATGKCPDGKMLNWETKTSCK